MRLVNPDRYTIIGASSDDPETAVFSALVRVATESDVLSKREYRWIVTLVAQLGSHRWAGAMLNEVFGVDWVVALNDVTNALDRLDDGNADGGASYQAMLKRLVDAGFYEWKDKWCPGFAVQHLPEPK